MVRTAPAGASTGYLLFVAPGASSRSSEGWTLAGSPRLVADNVGARSMLGRYSVSENGILATVSAGDLIRAVSIVSFWEGETLFERRQARQLQYIAALAGWAFARARQEHGLPGRHHGNLAHGSGERLAGPFVSGAGVNALPVRLRPAATKSWDPRFGMGATKCIGSRVSGSTPEELIQSAEANGCRPDRDPQ